MRVRRCARSRHRRRVRKSRLASRDGMRRPRHVRSGSRPCSIERRFHRRRRREGSRGQPGRRAMPRERNVKRRSATLGLVVSGHELNGRVGVGVVRLRICEGNSRRNLRRILFSQRTSRASPTRAKRSRTQPRALARRPKGVGRGGARWNRTHRPNPHSKSQKFPAQAARAPCPRSATARRSQAARSAFSAVQPALCSRARSPRIGCTTCSSSRACRQRLERARRCGRMRRSSARSGGAPCARARST